MKLKPINIKTANDYIDHYHRHHKRVQGHRFSISVVDDNDKIIGVATIGRPVNRNFNDLEVLEVTRLCTDGSKNACSFLYSAGARIGKAMGYKKIQTYILESELGTSLKASGWNLESITQGRQWKHTDGKPRRIDQPSENKQLWVKYL